MQSSFPYIFSHRTLYARLLSAFYVFFFFVPRTVYGTFSGRNRLWAFGCMDITFHSLQQCWLPLFPKCSTNRMKHFLFFAGSGDSCFQGCVSSPVFSGEKLYFAVLFAMQIYATILQKLKTKTVAIMQIASGFCHLAGMGHLVLVQLSHPNNHRPMALTRRDCAFFGVCCQILYWLLVSCRFVSSFSLAVLV